MFFKVVLQKSIYYCELCVRLRSVDRFLSRAEVAQASRCRAQQEEGATVRLLTRDSFFSSRKKTSPAAAAPATPSRCVWNHYPPLKERELVEHAATEWGCLPVPRVRMAGERALIMSTCYFYSIYFSLLALGHCRSVKLKHTIRSKCQTWSKSQSDNNIYWQKIFLHIAHMQNWISNWNDSAQSIQCR